MLARRQRGRTSRYYRRGLSVTGFFIFIGAIAGYFAGGAFVLCAILKFFHPRTAGLWSIQTGPDDIELSLRMGFGEIPAGGHELLGWWIVPVALLAGCGLVIATTRVVLWCARRCAPKRFAATSQTSEGAR